MQQDDFQYFSSGVGIKELSNFSACEFEFDGVVFPSSEHAYQSNKFVETDKHRFAANGDLSNIENLSHFYKEGVVEKKIKLWSNTTKLNNKPVMVGIVAKLASNPKHAKQIGLTMKPLTDPNHEANRKANFKRILHSKFQQNPHFKSKLMSTGDKMLIEFSRGAARVLKGKQAELWTGLVKDGVLYGQNLMGVIMEEVRSELR